MRNQIIKGLGAAGLTAMLAMSAGAADAAGVQCRIPFSFTVNGKTLPPGSYTLSTLSTSSGALAVQTAGHAALVLTSNLYSTKDGGPRAVFHRYGEQLFLSQVWTVGGVGRQIPEPRLERERITTATRLGNDVEQVVIPIR